MVYGLFLKNYLEKILNHVAVGREDEVDGVGAELGAELHECVVDL